MKKIHLVVLSILILTAVCPQLSFAGIKNSPDGFGGMEWGDPVSKLGTSAELLEETDPAEIKGQILKMCQTEYLKGENNEALELLRGEAGELFFSVIDELSLKTYRRKDYKPSIGAKALSDVLYLFNNNRLIAVCLEANEENKGSARLKETLTSLYGKCSSNGKRQFVFWLDANTFIMYMDKLDIFDKALAGKSYAIILSLPELIDPVVKIIDVKITGMRNSPDGFAGMKWGDPASKLGKRSKLYKSEGALACYKRQDKNTPFSRIVKKPTSYYFIDDKLDAVIMSTEGTQNCNTLRDTAFSIYGEPDTVKGSTCIWGGLFVNIKYLYFNEGNDDEENHAYLIMRGSKPWLYIYTLLNDAEFVEELFLTVNEVIDEILPGIIEKFKQEKEKAGAAVQQ